VKRFLYYSLTLMGVLWLQILCNHFLGGSWVSLNGVLVAVLFFGLSRGPLVGQLMGFTWGPLMDASSLGLMGLHTLIYAAAGYAGGMLRRQLDETKAWTQAIFSFAATVVYLGLYITLYHFFSIGGVPISWRLSLQPLANAAIAPLEFWLLQRWSEAWSIFPVEQ